MGKAGQMSSGRVKGKGERGEPYWGGSYEVIVLVKKRLLFYACMW